MSSRRLAVAAWLAALAGCLFQVFQTRFVADLSSFLPETPTAEQRLLVDQLRDGAPSRMMLIGIEGAEAPVRADLSRALAAALRADSLFVAVDNGADAGFQRERDVLFAHRYVLSPRVTPERFTVEGLRSAIAETIDLLASPVGLLLKPLAARDPTGETLAAAEQLSARRGPRKIGGVWASPQGERMLLVVRTRASGSDTEGQARALARVEGAFRDAAASAGSRASTARLLVTGPGVFSVRARATIERDVVRLSAWSMLIVVTALLLVYRSARALVLGFVPVISGALAGIAAVSLGFGTVHGITLGFGTTLIGEAVDYSIYLFVQTEPGNQAGDRAWLDGFWPTIRIGVLTSIAGFCALLFSGLPGLMQLGLYSITGLIVAAAVARFVLPALLPSRFRVRDLSALGRRIAAIAASMSRLRAVVPLLVLAAILALFVKRDMLWDPKLSSLNPISERDGALDAELRAQIGASDARQMIAVTGSTADGALEAAERIGRELDGLVANGEIGGYESPARFLPSASTQRARLASLPGPDELRSRLRAALATLPMQPGKLEPFVADVERARSQGPMKREALAGTALESALDGLLFRDSSGHWAALIGLRPPAENPSAGIDRSAVVRAIAVSGVQGAVFLDIKQAVDRMYSGYFDRALLMSSVGMLAIVALLFGALRSAVRLARVMAPLVAGVLVVAAAHAVCGARMSLLHLVGLLLVVAIGSNYALFFDRIAVLRDGSSARTLASLALANFTTVASFGILALSPVPVLRAIGSTVAAGAFLVLLFSAILSGAPGPVPAAGASSGH